MKRVFAGVVIVGVLGAALFGAYRAGLLRGHSGAPFPAPSPAGGPQPGAPSPALTGVPPPATPPPGALVSPDAASPAASSPVNLAALDAGGHIESATSEYSTTNWSALGLIDADPKNAWRTKDAAVFPHEIVFSFLGQQPALISAVILTPSPTDRHDWQAKDVEIWTSMTSATDGFTKAAGATLEPGPGDRTITFGPVEARFVKLRIVSNNGNAPPQDVVNKVRIEVGKVKIVEAQRSGYTPLLARSPEVAALLAAASGNAPRPDAGVGAPVPGAAAADCSAGPPVQGPPSRYPETHKALVVVDSADRSYPPFGYQTQEQRDRPDQGIDGPIYGRVRFTTVKPREAAVASLPGFDTVVLSQLCNMTRVSESFKKGLIAWVAQGHKLIIQDADACGKGPDYGFLPYPFATSNPGARGAPGDRLLFVEENTIGNGTDQDPAYLDLPAWLLGNSPETNELGDSNTIVQYDPHWCGHLFGTNVLKKNGFMEAYAHYGRGLIIYDGFDHDQVNGKQYRQLVTRELAQPFDPDNLPCSARLGDFVITTEQRLKTQPMVPARTYTYPLTLLSNQAYKGTVKLALTTTPADPTLSYRFEPDAVPLDEIAQSTLTVVTQAASPPTAHMFAVRGADTAGKSNGLCLALVERKTGGLQILNTIRPAKKPTKNLEVILDASGSMKLRLGKSTRWATALDVLSQVVAKLPDDFNVALRVYGHRYPSTSKETCTDSQLVLPPAPLDRNRILSAIRGVHPRGETPLVYSVLQTAADLKGLGGGTVIVITDGEESCGGNPQTAAQQLKDSGIDITLDIVGFTLTGQKVQQQLTQFAEATGGRYYGAQSGDALARALWIAAVDKFPYTILDATGKQVAKGDAGAPPEELEPGEYRVVVKVADQELTDQVVVTSGGDVVLRVALKGDKFVIER